MIAATLAAALLCAAPLPHATNHTALPRFADATPEALPKLIGAVAALPDHRARVLSASERFLGVAYRFDPLGEGPGKPPDEDPRLRWDEADCQTYVETVMALSRVKSSSELLGVMDDIRYDGGVSYVQRNHFFEAHWLAANVRKGYVRDVTFALMGKDAARHTKVVTVEQYRGRRFAGTIKLPPEREPVGRFEVSYLPLAKVLERARDIPSGTMFAIIRADQPDVPTMVAHLGLVVQKPEGTFLRHAGSDLYKQVVDEELAHLVKRSRTYKKWPVLGLMLLELVPASP